MIHFARLDHSPRLQRTLDFLRQCGNRGATTMEIIRGANVCAINSIAAELRHNGYIVRCENQGKIFRYFLEGN